MRMAEYVSLERIIDLLQEKGQQSMTYQEFQPTFEEKVKRETYLENILLSAMDLIQKDQMADAAILNELRVLGSASNESNLCDACQKPFKLDKQFIEMFKCGHNFHRMCLKEAGKDQCRLCFNEYDHIRKFFVSDLTLFRANHHVERQRSSSADWQKRRFNEEIGQDHLSHSCQHPGEQRRGRGQRRQRRADQLHGAGRRSSPRVRAVPEN